MKQVATARIEKGKVWLDNQLLATSSEVDFKSQATDWYRTLETSYPKFFKMDEVCKLAFIAGEALLKNQPVEQIAGSNTAVLLTSKFGCMTADKKHRDSYIDANAFFPSPAVFVYTLPNIMLGEICIRHKITGEANCLMMDTFDKKLVNTYVSDLINREKYGYCIAGWADYAQGDYLAELSLFTKGVK